MSGKSQSSIGLTIRDVFVAERPLVEKAKIKTIQISNGP
jgi:hypothetical protein